MKPSQRQINWTFLILNILLILFVGNMYIDLKPTMEKNSIETRKKELKQELLEIEMMEMKERLPRKPKKINVFEDENSNSR